MAPRSLLLVFALASSCAVAQEDGVRVAATYSGRVAHIESIGKLFNDAEEIGSGSGLLIGDRHVLTNNHVIPLENNFKKLTIHVRLKTRLSRPREVASVERDPERDLALLTLSAPAADAPRQMCPVPVIRTGDDAPVGTSIYVLGFPLNEDLGITRGLLSSHTASHDRWRTDNLITYGHSGSPAFDGRGSLVGVAVAGIGSFTTGGKTFDVDGVNFIIPATSLAQSSLMRTIVSIPQDVRCWRDADGRENFANALADRPATLSRSFTHEQTKDDHPIVFAPHERNYEQRFNADPGYRVTSCAYNPSSANHASNVSCEVADDGRSAVFRYRLTSGPTVDRWRGWWAGTITLSQRLSL